MVHPFFYIMPVARQRSTAKNSAKYWSEVFDFQIKNLIEGFSDL